MKYIKSRNKFLSEAKIKDVVLKKQAQAIRSEWGAKFLDYEEITPTENIKQGRWKLSEEDKTKALNAFFSTNRQTDVKEAQNVFAGLPDKFAEIISLSLADLDKLDPKGNKGLERAKEVLQEFDIKNPSIDEMVAIFEPVFRKLDPATAAAEEILFHVVDGRQVPVMGEDGRPQRVPKEVGKPVFSKNLVNIHSMVADFNKYYSAGLDENLFYEKNIASIVNLAKDDVNSEFKTSFRIFGKDMYLNITHNPKDILNMSISKYYSSCQHLYTGMYKKQVIGNVFDPNSIPAFLEFDTPIYNGEDLISERMPLARMIIRNIEGFDTSGKPVIFFDRAYPDRMKDGSYGDVFGEIVEKYSGNIKTKENIGTYTYTPDIDPEDLKGISDPYMDRMQLLKKKYIGVNTKKLYLKSTDENGMLIDWSKVKVAPGAKISELIIETPNLPENLLDLKLDLDWIKFRAIDIKNLAEFKNISFEAIAFDKCKFTGETLKEILKGKNSIKRLQLLACDVDGLSLSGMEFDELQLVYTLDGPLKPALENAKFKKLVVSGDLMQVPGNKEYLNYLKQNIAKDEEGKTIRDESGKAVKINDVAPAIEITGINLSKKRSDKK